MGPVAKAQQWNWVNSGYYGQLDSKPHLCASQRSVLCLYSKHCVFHSRGISIDHEELLLHPGCCKLAQDSSTLAKKRKKKKRWFVNSETELWADKQPESIFMKLLMFRYFEWAVNQVSINVSISKFYHSLWNWWRRKSFCLSLVQESLYWSQHSYRIQDSNGC